MEAWLWNLFGADSSPTWLRPLRHHLNALEEHGLVRLAQERKWGGLTERLLVATAASYIISPSALGPVAVDPNREVDRHWTRNVVLVRSNGVRRA